MNTGVMYIDVRRLFCEETPEDDVINTSTLKPTKEKLTILLKKASWMRLRRVNIFVRKSNLFTDLLGNNITCIEGVDTYRFLISCTDQSKIDTMPILKCLDCTYGIEKLKIDPDNVFFSEEMNAFGPGVVLTITLIKKS